MVRPSGTEAPAVMCIGLDLIGQSDWACASEPLTGDRYGLALLIEQLLPGHWQAVKEGLHRRLAVTPSALVGADLVVLAEPFVQVGLQLGDRPVELLAKGNAVELVQHGLVEALADPIRLRALGLGPTVVDILDRQVELVLVPLGVAAVFAAAVGQHPAERDAVLLIERQHPVIEQIGGGDRGLDVVELGEADLGVGVDEGLLVDATHPLQRPDIEGVLGTAVTGTGAVELAMGFLVGLRLLQSGELALGQDQAILRHPGLQSLQPLGHGVEVVANPDAANAGGGDPQALARWPCGCVPRPAAPPPARGCAAPPSRPPGSSGSAPGATSRSAPLRRPSRTNP